MTDPLSIPDSNQMHERYQRVCERVAESCTSVGRTSGEVTVVAVSKTFPDAYIRALYGFGHRDFGENKVQDLTSKHGRLVMEEGRDDLNFHMIGHLQRNKARDVVRSSTYFHALDSLRLARELNKRAAADECRLKCFVQVNISRESTKHGLTPDQVHASLNELSQFENLSIIGLMAMAEPIPDPEMVRGEFAQLRNLMDSWPAYGNPGADLKYLSMGMTQDFEVAIQEGATHIRVGSAIFGPRACMLTNPDKLTI